MDARNRDQIGLDVENPDLPDSKDTGRHNGSKNTASPAQGAAVSPVSSVAPGTVVTQMDPIFGDQVFNIQWVLMIFWPLLIPILVAVFLPLCNAAGRRFPTISYKRGWIGNLVMSIVMLLYWLILIIAYSAADRRVYD